MGDSRTKSKFEIAKLEKSKLPNNEDSKLGSFMATCAMVTHKIGSEPVRLPASTIQLNGTLSYYLAILDPNLHFWAESPDILPRSFLRLKENTSYLVHMKVQ